MPPTLVSEGGGPHLGAQQASCARVGQANALLSKGLSCLPLLISAASLLCPQDQCSRREGVALEGRGLAWELSKLPGPKWAGQMPSTPLLLLPEGPSHLPLLISLGSGALILSDLHFSSPLSTPMS